ncbi:MAG: DUF4038 domain-containing protein [Kiritimatiellae bacterium]|nr:DUF4038 domain-containing protein [Kiritimatiellia bacterium]
MSTTPASPWARHGRLGLAPNGHYLQHADGTPFFWLGDTAWALHQNLSREDVCEYLDDAAAKRFTVVQLMAVNHWALADGRNFFGEPPYTGGDATKLNGPYWDHLAWVCDAAAERGLYVLLVYGCPGRTDERMAYVETAADAYAYAHALGKRLGARPNLIWSGGIDVNPDDTERVSAMGMAGWHAMAEGVADALNGVHAFDGEADYSAVLMTYHPRGASTSSTWFHEAPWLAFNGTQVGLKRKGGGDHIRPTITADYARMPAKPVVNLEPWYEGCNWKEPAVNDWDVRVQAYQSLFAGAFGHTYGHNAVWGLDSPRRAEKGVWKRALDAPGRVQMQHVRALFESQPLPDRIPDLPLVAAAADDAHKAPHIQARIVATGDAQGRYVFVYSPQGRAFTMEPAVGPAGRTARWYDPRTGAYQAAAPGGAGSAYEFEPPGTPGEGNDWVLVLAAGE